MKFSRSDKIVISSLLTAIALSSSLLWAHNNLRQNSFGEKSIGKIIWKRHRALRRHAGRIAWDDVEKESLVYPYDAILTEENSDAEIHLQNGNIKLMIEANTMVVLDFLNDEMILNLEKGSLKANSLNTLQMLASSESGKKVKIEISKGESAISSENGKVNLKVSSGSALVKTSNGQESKVSKNEAIFIEAKSKSIIKKKILPSLLLPTEYQRYISMKNHMKVLFKLPRDFKSNARLELARNRKFIRSKKYHFKKESLELKLKKGDWYCRLINSNTHSNTTHFMVLQERAIKAFKSKANNMLVMTKLPILRWSNNAIADGYKIKISKVKNFKRILFQSTSKSTFFQMPQLKAGNYFWKVEPLYNNSILDQSLASNSVKFQIQTKSIAPKEKTLKVKKVSIDYGLQYLESLAYSSTALARRRLDIKLSNIQNGKVLLDWPSFKEGVKYSVKLISRDAGKVIFAKTTQSTDVKMPANLSPGRYYWQLSVLDKKSNVLFVAPKKIVDVHTSIHLLRPANKITWSLNYSGQAINFAWQSNGTLHYLFEVAKDDLFHKVVYSKITNSSTSSFSVLDRGTFYWRISGRTLGQAAYPIKSKVFVFEATSGLGGVYWMQPGDDEVLYRNKLKSIDFSWGNVEGADRYSLRIYHTFPLSESTSQGRYEFVNIVTEAKSYTFTKMNLLWKKRLYWEVRPLRGEGSKQVSGILKKDFIQIADLPMKK